MRLLQYLTNSSGSACSRVVQNGSFMQLVAVDPANSSCWSFHRWLLHCACCDIECPSTQHAATVPTAAADPASSEGGIPAAERRERAKALLRDERSMCDGIAQAEAARVEALAAEGGEVPDGGTESVTVSLARMAHMRALQAEADVLALQQLLADSEVCAPSCARACYSGYLNPRFGGSGSLPSAMTDHQTLMLKTPVPLRM